MLPGRDVTGAKSARYPGLLGERRQPGGYAEFMGRQMPDEEKAECRGKGLNTGKTEENMENKMAAARLKKGEGRKLKSGGLWIFDNEIDVIEGSYENGDDIRVEDFDGYPMGIGFINDHSKIRIRMMSRKADTVIDRAFLEMRVRAAWEYRKKTVDTRSCRVIFGEADFLPGLVVDKYESVLVVESLALGIEKRKLEILDILKEILRKDGIEVTGIYERSDSKVRKKEGMEPYKGFIGGEFDTKVPIVENGVKYIVDVKDGQKTGFFLDQKYNRLAMQRFCKGATVLDCFTHTGSFALNAAVSGAEKVMAVDASELAIAQAAENAALNGVEERMEFVCADVFDYLPQLEEKGEQFDVVILDPPAFTKSRNSVKNATKGYREINLRGIRLVKDGGIFATCSCSHFMTPELFSEMLATVARQSHRRLRQIEFRTQSPDHPILWAADESNYLKFYIFQVVDEK